MRSSVCGRQLARETSNLKRKGRPTRSGGGAKKEAEEDSSLLTREREKKKKKKSQDSFWPDVHNQSVYQSVCRASFPKCPRVAWPARRSLLDVCSWLRPRPVALSRRLLLAPPLVSSSPFFLNIFYTFLGVDHPVRMKKETMKNLPWYISFLFIHLFNFFVLGWCCFVSFRCPFLSCHSFIPLAFWILKQVARSGSQQVWLKWHLKGEKKKS